MVAQQPSVPVPREQLTQYVVDLQKNPSDDALRERIIKLALTLQPPPAEPAEAHETAGAATYAFKNASSPDDCSKAGDLFGKALLVAPWIADLYYNQGLSYEKAKRLDDAIKAFHFYLMAAPRAEGADQVLEKIGGLKYAKRDQQQQKTEQEKAEANEWEAAFKRWAGQMPVNQNTTIRFLKRSNRHYYFEDTQFTDPYYHTPLLYELVSSPFISVCPGLQLNSGSSYSGMLYFHGGGMDLEQVLIDGRAWCNVKDAPYMTFSHVCHKKGGRWDSSSEDTNNNYSEGIPKCVN